MAANVLRSSANAAQNFSLPWWVRGAALLAGIAGLAMACRRGFGANWRATWLALGVLILSGQAVQFHWIGRLPGLVVALLSALIGAAAAFKSLARPHADGSRVR
ncbi:MAG: hypothetical protein ACRD3O_09305 [Terriglobia bacterium]